MRLDRKLICLSLVLLFVQLSAVAQYDSILHQPLYKKSKVLRQLYAKAGKTDSASVKELQKFDDFVNAYDDKGLQYEARLIRIYGDWQKETITVDKAFVLGQNLAKEAAQQNNWTVEIRVYRYLAYMYWKDQKYENTFNIYHTLDQLLERLKPSKNDRDNWLDFSIMATTAYTEIAESHYFFKDYEMAVHYLNKTDSLAEVSSYIFPKIRSWNSLGLVYRDLGKLEESSSLFKKIIDAPNKDINPVWKAIAGGNLGHNYYMTGDYEKAIPLLEKDVQVSETYEIYGEALSASIDLGNIQLALDNLEAAGEQFRKAQAFMQQSSTDDKLHYTHLLFESLSKWNTIMGNHKLAILYIDSTKTAREIHTANFNSLKLMRAQQQINQQQNLLLMEKKQKEIQQRNLVILIVLLILAAGIVFYFFRNKYFLKKQKIKELDLQNSNQALQLAQTKLNNLTERVRENNNLIEILKESRDTEINQELLIRLKTSSILTNDDWKEYRLSFLEVYPHYIASLKKVCPDLTPSEIRCLCLEKLNLSNREMGSILGVSSSSVMVTKHRIRKKLSLTDQKELKNLIAQIS